MTMAMDILGRLKPAFKDLWKKSGFNELTAVQEKAIPLIIEGRDMIVQSPTGTGKTLAYLLPALDRIDETKQMTQAIILAPSRELVMQIHQEVQNWSLGSQITSAALVGGANIKRQIDRLKKKPHILTGTPGRILELIRMKKLKMHEVKMVVLDEGDQLLKKENLDTVRTIVKSTLNDRQLLLFSATRLEDPDQVKAMIGRDPEKLTAEKSVSVPTSIEHYYMLCELREKTKLLGKLAKMDGMKGLVFIRSVGNMNVIADKLQFEGVKVELLHSDLGKQERESALKRLQSGEINILLATDIAARGIDVIGLNHVIQYDLAEDAAQYVHRAGRTGRMGAAGTVVSLVNPRDERELKKYAKELGVSIERKRLFKGQLADIQSR
ncbi:DEAD/DEAH box helicase [Siminovitchia fordii]|uniref:DEAD-box ATP-dependent RNA helicase CshC n=1 Tax=Siminovitchia fordii TaxID=254759 RepID=A0ABQ4K593_9BACI|nr:DEAD/DEAH box helicase [Siminovitchia fordii]GIN20801.1 DEAD-box ATP-dependent RNA helicase CshC [Siminovitchia fordii]